jgi:hypothetical protein
MTLRVGLLALLLIPLQAFWLIHMELVRGGIWPTVLSLLFTVVFLLFVVAALNQFLRRLAPRWALRDEELLALYILLATGASLCGCDVGQTLVHILGAPYHFATPSNGWAEHFHQFLPPHLLVSSKEALKDFYRGDSTLYEWKHLRWWLGPAAGWCWFTLGLLCAGMSLCLLVRRQWIDHERLSFPIVQVPLAMTHSAGFWRQRRLWWGFALAGSLDLLNGLHELVPAVPAINVKQAVQLGAMFTDGPWRAIGWLPLTFYPFALGLGFLMPTEMSFSCVAGFVLWKAQRVIGLALGYPPPGFNSMYSCEQVAGVWLAVVLFAGWTGRHVWRRSLRAPESRGPLLLGAAGFAIMLTFARQVGMTTGFAACYFLVYLGFSLALTRMRAEFGPPCHDLYGAGPDGIFVTWMGSGAFRSRNLAAMAVFFWLSRESPRSHPMPHQLEGLYLTGAGRLPLRRMVPAMLIAGLLSCAVTFWVVLHDGYRLGSETHFGGPAVWFATEGFWRLDHWLLQPVKPDVGGQRAMLLALTLALGCLALRSRLPWFTFHPAGYAISSWWAIHLLWCPLLCSWLLKRSMMRYGGARAYREWRPFFFGLVLGEFVVGSLWQIAGLLGGFTAYAFWI